MKVTEVLFKRNYAISPLTMEHMHLSATVVVEEGETASDALKLAQKTVEDFYADACSKSVASEYEQNIPLTFVQNDNPKISLIEELAACDDYDTLKSYQFIFKTKPEQEFYESKLLLLTNK